MKRTWALAGVLLMTFAAARGVQAQRFGPQVAFGDDTDFAIGARGILALGSIGNAGEQNVDGVLSFNYFIDACDNCTYFEIDGLGKYNFNPSGSVVPYVVGGIDIAYFSFDYDEAIPGVDIDDSDTEIGLAAGGGIEFRLGELDAFADGRFTIGGAEQLVLAFGILFGN